jgi:hypothetical protein
MPFDRNTAPSGLESHRLKADDCVSRHARFSSQRRILGMLASPIG